MKHLYVEGMLLREVFRNNDNEFSICSLLLTGHNATEEILNVATKPVYESDIPNGFDADDYGAITISGYFPKLDDTKIYRFTGKWMEHQRYGWQFQVASFKTQGTTPASKASVVAYLSSDLFKGIGKKAAEKVVDVLGEDAVNLILKDRSSLEGIKGISEKQRDVLFNTLMDRQGDELVLGPLYEYGISPKFVVKIYKMYKSEALTIINKNPYQLITDIDGIGFVKADEIAKKIGISLDDPRRIRAAILHVMNRVASSDGHTFLYQEQLMDAAIRFLNRDTHLDESTIHAEIERLINNKWLSNEDGCLFLPNLKDAEVKITMAIETLNQPLEINSVTVEEAFDRVKETLDIDYSSLQKEAILTSLKSPISIITGGPGTGKTTVVNGILQVYDELYKDEKEEPIIKLASPTGRAAKRIEETTGRTASTIHRLLGYNRDGTFAVNEEEPLDADLVIIDEVSMLDTYLAYQLLTSLQGGTQLILVGDDNQLPSVGPGQILKDLIESEQLLMTRLMEIHRQAAGSSVITLAHDVNQGRLPADLTTKLPDRLFVPAQNDDILRLLEQVTKGAIDKGYTAKEVQVLIPMYRGPLGIDNVNAALQQLFNPAGNDKLEIVIGQKIFRENDKVLQLVNNPDADVMNGDVGEVIRITGTGAKLEVMVDFEGLEVAYSRDDLNFLTHAYATSIHKSQGSEYPVVIMPITRAYWIMLQRKLLYTGLTRASKSLILIGDYEALKYGVENQGALRQTKLKSRLKGGFVQEISVIDHVEKDVNPHVDYFVEHEIPFDGIDEVELEGRTPYDFM